MAKKRRNNTPEKIDPNLLPTRDYLLLALILGSTKSYVSKDKKKERSRKSCRGNLTVED